MITASTADIKTKHHNCPTALQCSVFNFPDQELFRLPALLVFGVRHSVGDDRAE